MDAQIRSSTDCNSSAETHNAPCLWERVLCLCPRPAGKTRIGLEVVHSEYTCLPLFA
jgi:hypothetical protein